MNSVSSPVSVLALILIIGSLSCEHDDRRARLPDDEPQPAIAIRETSPSQIETTTTELVPVNRPVIATGSTQPIRAANLTPETQGTIVEILVSEGDQVERGEVLVKLNSRVAQLQAAQARASASAAKVHADQLSIDHQRISKLAQAGAVAQIEVDQLRAQRDAIKSKQKAAEAASRLAGHMLRTTQVRAPFSGTISTLMMELGEFASMMPPRPILRIIDLSEVEVRVRVNEHDLVQIRRGDSVVAKISSIEKQFRGKVTHVGLEIHPLTRTSEIITTFDNSDGLIRGGMFAHVEILPETDRESIILPRTSIRGTGQSRFVYILDGCQAKRQPVEIASFDDKNVEIRRGLKEGIQVITRGTSSLTEGMTVESSDGRTCGETISAQSLSVPENIR